MRTQKRTVRKRSGDLCDDDDDDRLVGQGLVAVDLFGLRKFMALDGNPWFWRLMFVARKLKAKGKREREELANKSRTRYIYIYIYIFFFF